MGDFLYKVKARIHSVLTLYHTILYGINQICLVVYKTSRTWKHVEPLALQLM